MKFENKKKIFLSNYYQSKFKDTVYSNLEYNSVEHFFNSMKYFIPKSNNYDTHVNNIIKIKEPKDVGVYTKAYPYMCSNFCNLKDQVMKNGLIFKFEQNNLLKKKLINTKGNIIADIDDQYWGIGKNKNGRNKLGLLLEEVREELKF